MVWWGGSGEGLRSDREEVLPLSKSKCSILPTARRLRAGAPTLRPFYCLRAVLLSSPRHRRGLFAFSPGPILLVFLCAAGGRCVRSVHKKQIIPTRCHAACRRPSPPDRGGPGSVKFALRGFSEVRVFALQCPVIVPCGSHPIRLEIDGSFARAPERGAGLQLLQCRDAPGR
jgi:hypothetical protein